MKKIAILGAGYFGLAIAWHLHQAFKDKMPLELVIFDGNGIGGGASGIAAGLLHPYAGLRAKYNLEGQEGCEATRKLIEVASKASGLLVAKRSGILRLALFEEQQIDYKICAEKYPLDVEWLTEEQCQQKVQGVALAPGLFIHSGITVYSDLYIRGLWKACEVLGTKLKKTHVHSIAEIADFDLIIVAMGSNTRSLLEFTDLPFADLPITSVKGQLLEIAWPKDLPPLSVPLNSQAYLVMSPDNRSCILGSTFEREFLDASPNLEMAKREILPKAVSLMPLLAKAPILDCTAGIRASTPNHLPLMKQFNPRCWVLTGLGSKGLLYHALYAEKLVTEIMQKMRDGS
jgi:glycine/D-amino acid oxidase-like deaminating enzyme